MKKINHIINKIFDVYEKKNLVLMIMIKNIIKSKINVITLQNTEGLLIQFAI